MLMNFVMIAVAIVFFVMAVAPSTTIGPVFSRRGHRPISLIGRIIFGGISLTLILSVIGIIK
jgi:hypothetical protein